jgi:hypothetical protein
VGYVTQPACGTHPALVPTGRAWRKFGKAGTEGEFAFGPYAVTWSRGAPPNARTAIPAEFVVRARGVESVCQIENAMPRTTELAQGVDALVDGRSIRIQRNGLRLFRRQRTIRCTAPDIDWIFRGRWIGHPPLLDRERTIWTPRRGGQVAPDLPSNRAALVVALVASGVPETTTLANALQYI